MDRALRLKLHDPKLPLLDALEQGGFKFDRKTWKDKRDGREYYGMFDMDGDKPIRLEQRKNQRRRVLMTSDMVQEPHLRLHLHHHRHQQRVRVGEVQFGFRIRVGLTEQAEHLINVGETHFARHFEPFSISERILIVRDGEYIVHIYG